MASYPQCNFDGSMVEGGYISPHFLDIRNAASGWTSQNDDLPKPYPGIKLRDVGTLETGKEYQLSQDPIPTPQSILDGSYLAALERSKQCPDVVIIVPRLPKHCGAPSLPSITFSVTGRTGPYVSDLALDNVVVDSPADLVFQERVWKQTSLTIDWPGVATRAEYIPCVDKENHDLTRMQVAKIVALRVHEVIMTGRDGQRSKWGHQAINKDTKAWNLKKIDYQAVRLLAINYYRRTWIPVLALSLDA